MTKVKGNYEGNDSQARINFGQFGFIERTQVAAPRGSGSYDQHRIAKGDDMAVVSDTLSFGGGLTEDTLKAALAATFGREIDSRDVWFYAYGSVAGFMYGEKKLRKGCAVCFA